MFVAIKGKTYNLARYDSFEPIEKPSPDSSIKGRVAFYRDGHEVESLFADDPKVSYEAINMYIRQMQRV
jgi:hypothetical protein